MSNSPTKRRPEHGAFVPANTLNSTTEPSFPLQPTSGNATSATASGNMSDSRNGAKAQQNGSSASASSSNGDLGSFYAASHADRSGFNSIPNSRAANLHSGVAASFADVMSDYGPVKPRADFKAPEMPFAQPMQSLGGGIMRPAQHAPPTIPAALRPTFESIPRTSGFNPVNAKWSSKGQRVPINDFVDLTKDSMTVPQPRRGDNDEDDAFDPNKALGGDKFGEYDPMNYMDAAQASDNIQKLLEGAFEEDDEDKPKTRLRRRKQTRVDQDSAADRLAAKLKEVHISKEKKEQVPQEEEEEDDGSVDGLNVKLLPHQIDGVAWMMDKESGERKRNGVLPKGGILADDMGLGKTIQAISLILSNPRPTEEWIEQNPKKKFPKAAGKGTLVVAPLALIKQWEAEIKEKVTKEHKLKVLVHHGPSRTKRFDELKKFDIVITTYQTLTSEHDGTSPDENGIKVGCFGVHWYRVILDEAHSIKNRNAKMTKAAYNLNSVYRWCLTGTPMQNNLDELQSLIQFLRVKPYMDLRVWKEQISSPMKNGRGGLAMRRLQYFLKALMKRRTKDILKQSGALKFGKANANDDGGEDQREGFKIVARTIQTVETDFSEKEREFYDRLAARTERSLDAMMGEKKDYIGALVLLLRLRQICNHPGLIKNNLKKEDTVPTNHGVPAQRGKDDVEDIADMFGSLSVEAKKCDVCQVVLSTEEAAAGSIRCAECDADIAEQEQQSMVVPKKQRKKKDKQHRHHKVSSQRQRKVVESDDEDAKGEWVVPPSQQQASDLGKAGGQEDEDAEGGGEWLKSEDESSENEQDASAQDSFISHDTDPDSRYYSSSDESEIQYEAPSKIQGHVASTKIKHLLEILRKDTPTNKAIVFSEFTSMLDLIQPHLKEAGISYVRYDGKMANPDREASLHALRNDKHVRVLLCSLRCGSLGLNLTAASRVVLMEPFWNPFVEEQAIDRVHRLNQTQDVLVYKLTVRGTVEERILALQERKRELAKAAIEGGAGAGKGKMNLSMSDVLALFKRDAADVVDEGARTLGSSSVRVLPTSRVTTVGPGAPPTTGHRVVSGPGSKGKSQFDPAYGRRW